MAEKAATFWPGSGHPAAELDGGLDDRGARRADSNQGTQFGFRAVGQTPQVACVGQQIMSDLHDILPLTTRTEEDCQQFGVGQTGRSSGKEPFTWAIFGGESE
jgi:hypothetical protein